MVTVLFWPAFMACQGYAGKEIGITGSPQLYIPSVSFCLAGDAPAAAEEKKEEKKVSSDEESDDDMGFGKIIPILVVVQTKLK